MKSDADNWREKALHSFPFLHDDLEAPDYSIYQLFFDLAGEVSRAHRVNNTVLLEAIYDYAEWALRQPDKELWNSAAVAFYESLFDGKVQWEDVLPWLSPFVIEMMRDLWEWRLEGPEWRRLAELLTQRCKGL